MVNKKKNSSFYRLIHKFRRLFVKYVIKHIIVNLKIKYKRLDTSCITNDNISNSSLE